MKFYSWKTFWTISAFDALLLAVLVFAVAHMPGLMWLIRLGLGLE